MYKRKQENRSVKSFPIADWLPSYERKWMKSDLIAAFSLWAVSIPSGLAFAAVAGLPVEYGLYAGVFSMAAYSIFGTSRHLVIGPTSTTAIITASTVAPLAVGKDAASYIGLSVLLALITGALLLIAGIAKLGFISNFLAKPVLEGFILAMSVTIIVGQISKLVGVSISGSNIAEELADGLRKAGDWSLATLAVGIASLIFLLILSRLSKKIPSTLCVMVLSILASSFFGFAEHGIDVVGHIPKGLPEFTFSGIGIRNIFNLLPGALALFVVCFVESVSIAKSYASKLGGKIDPDQELVALGAANMASGLFQGFSVDASLSKTASAVSAGGKTPMVSLGCSALTLATIFFLTDLFKNLPQATLGAIIIFSVSQLIALSEFKRYQKTKKTDLALAVSAFFGVLLIGVLEGIMIGVILSLLAIIGRISWPNTEVLGRDSSGFRFASIDKNPDCKPLPGMLIYRFDSSLIFSNADFFREDLKKIVNDAEPPYQLVIIDCEMIHDMDTTASDVLLDLHGYLNNKGILLYMARVHGDVRGFMSRDGVIDAIGAENFFPKVIDAVTAFFSFEERD